MIEFALLLNKYAPYKYSIQSKLVRLHCSSCGDIIDKSLQSFTLFIIILWILKLGITMLIHNKDDIEFVTEFPCFLGHPVSYITGHSL